jgi:UDP-N-acetylmuramate dehydrogenase
MNAGAYGGEMSQVLESARVYIPGEGVKTLTLAELKLGYRESIFIDDPSLVVLSATVRLQSGEQEAIREQMRDLMARRKATQPLEYPSAGSTFKRPVGHFAGALIESSGLKGFTVGGAQVSEKHAGFVINIGGATCDDVTELIRRVQEIVFEKTGVRLEPEVRIIG